MPFSRFVTAACLATAVACMSSYAQAEDSWQELLRRAPGDANVLVMIDAEKVRSSEFANTAGWNSVGMATGGLRSILPRGAIQRGLFAARLNLIDFSTHWEAIVLETKSDASLDMFAAGIVEPRELLGTIPGARLPFDAYLLELSPRIFGVLGPADRQQAASWGRSSTSSKSLSSAYLTKIASFPETVGTEIMLGLDLADAVDISAVKRAMSESPTIRDAKIDPNAAAQVVASIEGMALGVRVLDEATGMIRVDFTRDPSLLANVMKALLLERLEARGVMIEDFKSWTLKMQGNTAFIGGKMSPVGLSLVLSIVEPELPADQAAGTPFANGPQPAKRAVDMAKPSQEHFAKVSALVTEIRFPRLELSPASFGTWIDRQARRIDQLPILDVDPDLLDYSQGVAKSLRVTAGKQRGAMIRASANPRNTYNYNSDYRGAYPESNSQIQARMEASAANLEHVDIMRMIDDETAAIRRTMSERYRVEF